MCRISNSIRHIKRYFPLTTSFFATGSNTEGAAIVPNNGRGGAVIWLGDHGTIRGCDFDDSKSKNEGASLYVVGDSIKVLYSNFTNSETNSSGGIYIEGSDANMGHCYMENTSAQYGGALYVKGNYITLSDSLIINSTSSKDGSAIYVSGNTTHIENSNITRCKSSDGDATILIAGYKTVLDGVNVENSTAKNAGAVKITGSETSISNSNFTNNKVSGSAGGIWIMGDDNVITSSNISNNIANGNGGGVYYNGDRNTVSYSNLDHNTAVNGANVYMAKESKNSQLLSSNITNSRAGHFGGGIEWEINSEYGLIKDCYFYNLSSNQHGGAVHWWPGIYGQIDNCTFVDCFVEGAANGGAIYAGATSGNPVGTVLSNSTFINCTSGTRGSVNWNVNGGLIYNNTFINCGGDWSEILNYGGRQALQIEKGHNTQIIECKFYNCTGIGGGGALRLQQEATNVTIANCIFDNCCNNGTAGALYITDAGKNITLENNTFTNNHAPSVGALDTTSAVTFKSFANNTFINNTATSGDAGAARLSTNTNVVNSTFISNTAAGAGGAVFAHGVLYVSRSIFENNTAGTNGGAISSNNGNNNGAVYVNQSSFKYNKARIGSAIRAFRVSVNDSELLENQADFTKWDSKSAALIGDTYVIKARFVGEDNYLNAINANTGEFYNVSYCGINGGGLYEAETTNTNDVTAVKSQNEVHQMVYLEIYNYENELIDTLYGFTDGDGVIQFNIVMANPEEYSYRVS